MRPNITPLIPFDKDGALQEAAERVDRATFFRRGGLIAAGGLLAGSLPVALARGQGPSKGDIAILNFALTLEFLEAAFYKDALSGGAVSGQYRTFAEVAGEHEQAHVDALKDTLGSEATAKPSFDFGGATADQATFAQTAKTVEDLGVEAYQGAAVEIQSAEVLTAAISIHPVEARHAAWIASIIGMGSGSPSPAPAAFNPAKDMAAVLAAVQGTGFITMGQAESGSAVQGQPQMTG